MTAINPAGSKGMAMCESKPADKIRKRSSMRACAVGATAGIDLAFSSLLFQIFTINE